MIELKEYVQYLIDVWVRNHPNRHLPDPNFGNIYHQMNQFVNEGKIKDIIDQESSNGDKISVATTFEKMINKFNGGYGINSVMTLEEFKASKEK